MNGKPTYRFKTNIPVIIHFESNEPQTGMGQYGEWYRYDVVVHNLEQVVFASKGLQDKLSKLGLLFGRSIEITKTEGEGGRIFWRIRENGIDITPGLTQEQENQPPLLMNDKTEKNNLQKKK